MIQRNCMDLESILREYGERMKLGKLGLDSSGICTLLVEDHLVSFEKSLHHEGFYVYSSIGHIPSGREQELGLMVLEGNLFGKETGRASIGYVGQSRTLVLFEYFDHETTDFTNFSQRFKSFLQHLFYWIVKLESADQFSSQKSDASSNRQNVFFV